MELFHRRYLCFFAFLFIFTAFICTLISGGAQIIAIVVSSMLMLSALAFAIFNKRLRFAFAVCFMALLFVVTSLINSFAFVTIPTQRAQGYIGSTTALRVEIIGVEEISEESSEYTVRVKQIGDEKLNIKATLHCDFYSSLSYGDTALVVSEIGAPLYRDNSNRDKLLWLTVKDGNSALHKEAESANYFSADGIKYISRNMRNAFGEYVDEIFGEENGALVRGFLINDTSQISSAIKSDFRRSGTSHLLAVSGLHIAIFMGAIELLLKKILVPKKARCIIAGILSLLLLCLTDFSASAVRSVIMLFAVYLSYMLSEDDDGVSALFVSVALIILISPFSVYDLGMWLSFFATLGLLTLYPFLEAKIPRVKTKRRISAAVLKLASGIAKAALLTFVANVFILPISWYFFGEVSLVAIPTNLLISPLATVYMPLCAVTLMLGAIPYLGGAFVFVASWLGELILLIADLFAGLRGAMLSLAYPFVTPLIIAFIAVFSVLLVVRLKQKLWVCLPPAVFCVLFAVFLGVYNLNSQASLRYIGCENTEILFFDKADNSTVCDVSSGGFDSYFQLYINANPYATEIENYVITHCHSGHVYSLERVLSSLTVRRLYLPLVADKEELIVAGRLYLLAREYGVEVAFYESGEEIEIFDEIKIIPHFEVADKHTSVYLSVERNGRIFTYADATETDDSMNTGCSSRYFLLGEHGRAQAGVNITAEASTDCTLIFASHERMKYSALASSKSSYVIKPQNNEIKLEMPLG